MQHVHCLSGHPVECNRCVLFSHLPQVSFLPRPAIFSSPISPSRCFLVGGSRPGDTFAAAEQSASLPPRSERCTGPHKTQFIPATSDDHARGVNRAHGNVAGHVTSNEIMREKLAPGWIKFELIRATQVLSFVDVRFNPLLCLSKPRFLFLANFWSNQVTPYVRILLELEVVSWLTSFSYIMSSF